MFETKREFYNSWAFLGGGGGCLHFVSNIGFLVVMFFGFLVLGFVFLVLFLVFWFSGFLLNLVAQQTFVVSCTLFVIYCMSDTDA